MGTKDWASSWGGSRKPLGSQPGQKHSGQIRSLPSGNSKQPSTPSSLPSAGKPSGFRHLGLSLFQTLTTAPTMTRKGSPVCPHPSDTMCPSVRVLAGGWGQSQERSAERRVLLSNPDKRVRAPGGAAYPGGVSAKTCCPLQSQAAVTLRRQGRSATWAPVPSHACGAPLVIPPHPQESPGENSRQAREHVGTRRS